MDRYKVSYYDKINYQRGRTVEIEDAILLKNQELIRDIQEFRTKLPQLSYDEQTAIKATFPAYMVSCQCGKSKNDIVSATGLICIDVDGLSTDKLCELKDRLKTWPYTFAVFKSIRGSGLAVIIKIACLDRFIEHYYSLESLFAKQGFTIDGKCKNMNRLRYVSYDEDLFINRNSITWNGLKSPPLPPIPADNEKYSDRGQMDGLIEYLIENRIDLTNEPKDWRKIGSCLNSYYPATEAERYFIKLSSFWPGDGTNRFSENECRKVFRERCVKFQIPRGVLFDIADRVGGVRYYHGEFIQY